MTYYETRSTDPFFNLAFEEMILEEERDEGVMLWQNEPCVVLGANQDAAREIDLAFAKAQGIHVARRKSGGGAVYHDLGNINYSFFHTEQGASLDFARFVRPIIDACARLGVPLYAAGRNDLVCADGRKVSGVAQRRCGARVLFHGTLLCDSDLSVLERVLTPDSEKLKRHAVKSVRARVCNLRALLPSDMDTAAIFAFLRGALSGGRAPTFPPADFAQSERVKAMRRAT